jgi:hypothetical protein
MNKIKPQTARYIKLGKGGMFEQVCIEQNNTIRLSYHTVPHHLCLAGNWDAVYRYFIEQKASESGAAARHRDQIKDFYKKGEDTLWVTFYKNRLWWCFAQVEVHLLPDGTKERKTISGWHDTDIGGNPLDAARLSGELLSMQGFRGTICRVKLFDYLIRKINAQISPHEQASLHARKALAASLIAIIRNLPWKEFELLVDLIFRQAGWQRLSEVGGRQKTLDLDLWSPIANERYLIQIKSRATRQEFEQFCKKTAKMEGYARYYFVVHSPFNELRAALETDLHRLWLPENIADLAVQYGLTDWLITKAI